MQNQQIKPGQNAIATIGDYKIPVTILSSGDGDQVKIALNLPDNWINKSQLQIVSQWFN